MGLEGWGRNLSGNYLAQYVSEIFFFHMQAKATKVAFACILKKFKTVEVGTSIFCPSQIKGQIWLILLNFSGWGQLEGSIGQGKHLGTELVQDFYIYVKFHSL